MIEKLTEKQKKAMLRYQKRGFDAAYNTEKGNEEIATRSIKEMYSWANLAAPEVVFVDSPNACQEYLNARFKTQKYWEFAWYGEGGLEAYWVEYYRFYVNELGIEYSEQAQKRLDVFFDFISNSSFCVQLEGLVVISRKPVAAYRNSTGQPSRDGGQAFEWADGWGINFLNGINVPEWLVKIKAEDITVDKVIKEKNAEIRREIIRKMGIQKMLEAGRGTQIDRRKRIFKVCKIEEQEINLVKGGNWWQVQQGDVCIEYNPQTSENPFNKIYEEMEGKEKEITESLWDIDCGEVDGKNIRARYVVLENPSTSTIHFEGVVDNCGTVQEAHNWRRYMRTEKEWNPGQIS